MFVHPPVCSYTPICLYTPHMFIHPPGVYTHPHGPPCSQCSCMVLEHCMLWGVVFLLYVYWGTPSLFGGASPLLHPHTPLLVTCALLFSGYQFLCGGLSPSIEGFGGCFPHHLGRFGGHISSLLFTCSFLYIFYSALCLTS